MSEEILKVELAELLSAIRFKRPNGSVIEASDIEMARDCAAEIRDTQDPNAGQALLDLVNAIDRVTKNFPINVEFSVKVK